MLDTKLPIRRDWIGEVNKLMYAIIETGGKQYKVAEKDVIYVEKLDKDVDAEVEFEALVVADGETVTVGTPKVEGVKVVGKVLQQGKSAKVIVFKYKPKKDSKKKQGHRQPFTKVEIVSIGK
jgi:large subunit ribosomal protein L21